MKTVKVITGLKIENRVLYDDQDYLEYYSRDGLHAVSAEGSTKFIDKKFEVKVAEIQHFEFSHQPDLFLAVYDDVDKFLLEPFRLLRQQKTTLEDRVRFLEGQLHVASTRVTNVQEAWSMVSLRASTLERELIEYQEMTLWQRIKFIFGVHPT